MGLFNSLVELTTDALKAVAAPVEISVDLADAVVKPLAKVAKELADDVKSLKD